MKSRTFSLKAIFSLTTFAGIATACVAYPNMISMTVIGMLLLVTLFAAVIVAVLGSGHQRDFCFGYALFGFGFMLVLSPNLSHYTSIIYGPPLEHLMYWFGFENPDHRNQISHSILLFALSILGGYFATVVSKAKGVR